MKRKTCKSPDCINPVWARGRCLNCDRKAEPHRYEIKRSKPKPALSSQPSEKVSKNPICTPKKQKPIAKISEKQKRRLTKYRIRRDKFLKENPVCMFPDCTSRDVSCHHALGRVGNLLYDTRYFKSLCWPHHQLIENQPLLARQLGLSGDRLDKFK